MNERIRELVEWAEQLKKDEVSYRERLHNRYCTGDMEEEIFREKFAELIVEECRNVLADVYRQVPPECCGHFLYADEVLAKHFYGVKEQTESQKMAAAGYTRRPRGWTKEGTE